MVEDAEEQGVVSPALTRSTINNSQKASPNEKSIADSFKLIECHSVDLLVEKALCANDIPFNVLRSPDFIAMIKGVNHAPKDYKPPSYDKARTSLLDECKRDIEKNLAPMKDTWFVNGISIVSDGWTNIKDKPLINVIAANSRGSMFLYAENFEGIEKSGKAITTFLLKAVEEIGPSNVLQIVTDNAANCKLAGKEIEKDFVTKFSWIEDTHKMAKDVIKFFKNHGTTLALFRANSALELLKVTKTRFASHYILLRRISKCREALATSVVLMAWKEWLRSCDLGTRTLGEEVTATIGNDEFWGEVYNILAITKPIYLMIKFCDGEGPKMGEIYERMDCMLGEITDVMKNNHHASDFPQMQEILVQRWEKMNIPMHCLGFCLNPHFYDASYLRVEASGGVTRRSPNQDLEVVTEVMKAFDKIGEDNN
ncbi:hypothetical protein POM88_034819 [Heracleum sosnowskyi]|uniref:DUF659 domain-containing protein n=1 Tax=Heracleum sosnowskyi TaxID=360622 RepID=A0AAD8HM54_9APIA|nr:hypothetical protein POM88_034819 [Heracleum sosnowskyi]